MSEFLAEARILVRPDTTGFRAELEAALSAATKPITIPVVPVVSGGLSAVTAETSSFTAAQTGAAAATQATAAALEKETAAAIQSTAANSANTKSLQGMARGAASAGLSQVGLRGATLASSGAFLAGAAAVALFAKSLQSAAAFETELNVFRVTAGATADEMARVSAEAKQLGRDITLPGVTAGDAATAMTELAKAGLSVQDAMAGARGSLQLATAAQIDNATATKLVAGALNAFQLSGNEAVKVADLLTGAANESQGEISDMGTALSQAAAVAHLFGVSIEDTIALITELAQAGIAGGRAGTSLRVAFLRLVNPTGAAAKILKDLNVQIRDVNGNLRPEIFTDIQKALEGYTKAQQQARLATIFGSDAIRTAAIIGAKGTEGFDQTRAAIDEFGLAQRQAAARTSGLQGDVENLSNQVSSLGLTVGEVAKGPIGSLVQEIAQVVSVMNEAVSAAVAFGGAIKGVGSDVVGAIPFMDKLLTVSKEINTVLTFGPVGAFKIGADIAHQFGVGADEIKADAADIRAQILSIVKAGEQTGGDLGLNQTLVNLDLLVQQLNKGGPEAQKFASEIAGIRTELQKAGTTGFKIFPEDVTELFPDDLLSGAVARKAGEANRDALEAALPGRDLFSFTKASFDNVTKAIEVAGNEAAATARRVFANVVTATNLELAKLTESFDVAVAAGSTAGQLASLKKQAAEQQELIDAANKAADAAGNGNKGFATAVARRRAAQHELAGINQQIRSIEAGIASDAEKTAADVITSRNKADKAFLDSLGFTEGNLQNRVLQAQADASLRNDIATNQALRNFYIRSREEARATLKDAVARADAVQAFTRKIIQTTQTINSLKAQQVAAQREAQKVQRQAAIQSATLDVDFAQTVGNPAAEIRARERLIAQLRKQQALVKKGTNEWKQLRNDIAEQNAAIAAVTAEKKKQGQSFAQASFQFLQDQQGFASNLLGNLIPTGATGGLVGGGAPVSAALTPVAGLADGQSKSGPTAGQAQTTNSILIGILGQLKTLNGENLSPEATRQRRGQNAIFDYTSGY